MHRQILILALLPFLCTSCERKTERADYRVVPLPRTIAPFAEEKPFVLNCTSTISYPEDNGLLHRNANLLAGYIQDVTGAKLSVSPSRESEIDNAIVLKIDEAIENEEGYRLDVNSKRVVISGKTEAGVFYGMQTLRKSLPLFREGDVLLGAARIDDYPEFGYRGMHLDVARHFFGTEFIKRYLDILALHNINRFHWHLTDDQGWRIEIKKYPKLTETGSQRKETVIGRNSGKYDGIPYGGFYTQEEIKEIVSYAEERYIKIIPEIDIPGHTLAALAAYPEFGCTGGPYEVESRWGIFDDVLCIGNEDAMLFLEDVFDEVAGLFPYEYIHIGGDEAPRVRWEKCPRCQARIKAENLKADDAFSAEDRLQTYCSRRIIEFLKTKGKRVIGWDEMMEGDIDPHLTVMAWRGVDKGAAAARAGLDVIVVPSGYCYFDYYQTDKTDDEPLAIGNYISLEKVYSLQPLPEGLTRKEKKHIIGVQANLWSEYISSNDYAEYMVLPRMAALSEVQWTPPGKKDYRDFATRLERLLKLYGNEKYEYSTHAYDIKAVYTPKPKEKRIEVTLSTIDDAPIYFTLDGSAPTRASTLYSGPLSLFETAAFKAVAIRPEAAPGKVIAEDICFNKATNRPITLSLQPSAKYAYNGSSTLVDGLRGNDNYATGRWLGFIGGDVEAIIDLGKQMKVSKVRTHAIVDMSAWVMGLTGLAVSVSNDNDSYREAISEDYPADTNIDKHGVDTYEVLFAPVTARYIKVLMKRTAALPEGHNGEGRAPYMFIDEIVVE